MYIPENIVIIHRDQLNFSVFLDNSPLDFIIGIVATLQTGWHIFQTCRLHYISANAKIFRCGWVPVDWIDRLATGSRCWIVNL